jgi:hypothetical protein
MEEAARSKMRLEGEKQLAQPFLYVMFICPWCEHLDSVVVVWYKIEVLCLNLFTCVVFVVGATNTEGLMVS